MASDTKTTESYVEKPKTLTALREEIATGRTKATDLANEYYARIAKKNPRLNIYLSLTKERALAQAAHIDDLAKQGDPLPALAGIPLGLKDVMVMQGAPSTAGSAFTCAPSSPIFHRPMNRATNSRNRSASRCSNCRCPAGTGRSPGPTARRARPAPRARCGTRSCRNWTKTSPI